MVGKTMNTDPKTWEFPVLGGLISKGTTFNIVALRSLTADEQKKNEAYSQVAANARNRFKLFTILKGNYEQWWSYTRSLLVPAENLDDDEMVELDRLLLNFQSAAKSVIDQFRQEWIQQFRGKSEENQYDEYIKKLEAGCWSFAFFQDLRNFTQHCGLPVGNYARNGTPNSVSLQIEADPEWLLQRYKRWEKSGLRKEHGRLDLIKLTQEYFMCLQQNLGSFVANAFVPGMLEAHDFYAGLAKELVSQHPEAQFKIITRFNIVENRMDFQFKTPPANLLAWIGITVKQQ